jgi:hypothetical protein
MAQTVQKVQYPQAERQRKLQSLTFAANSILSRDLPRDTVLKNLQLRLSGSVVTTFASGTPVSDTQSTFDNIIPRVDIVVNGSRIVKSVRPVMMRIQQLYYSKIIGERRASSGAAAAVGNFPTADAGFTYGTTGQITTAAETILIPFEHMFCDVGQGRESTWLNLKGVASAELRLTCASFSSLLGFGNTAPVVYTSSTFIIDILTLEAQDVPPQIVFSDWKQTTKQITFSAQTSDFAIDLNRGNKLSALMLFAQDGAAGSTTTATGKLPNNLAMQKLQLLVNGQTSIKTTDFQSLQNQNRSEFGILAAMASNVSILDGYAYMNLLARRDITTALDVRPPMVDNVQLFVNTFDSTSVSYTNPVSLTLMTDEIVEPR